jgi:CheY-like chemotaxis protein
MPQKVLVVDDNATRLALTIAMIEECGRIGLGAPSGDRAQRLMSAIGAEIGILVTDVRMPGACDGIALARWTRENWPAVRIFVTSGYDLDPDASLPDGVVFLPKIWFSIDVIKFVLGADADEA